MGNIIYDWIPKKQKIAEEGFFGFGKKKEPPVKKEPKNPHTGKKEPIDLPTGKMSLNECFKQIDRMMESGLLRPHDDLFYGYVYEDFEEIKELTGVENIPSEYYQFLEKYEQLDCDHKYANKRDLNYFFTEGSILQDYYKSRLKAEIDEKKSSSDHIVLKSDSKWKTTFWPITSSQWWIDLNTGYIYRIEYDWKDYDQDKPGRGLKIIAVHKVYSAFHEFLDGYIRAVNQII